MSVNDNSVNIKTARDAYHHGDLRSALIDEGLRLLVTATADQFSLREVARNVGVSAPAVYRHFPDKAAFLAALAKDGLRRLGAAQAEAGRVGGKAGFAASGQAYVHFAIANPGLFRLIFTSSAIGHSDLRDDPEGSAGWLLHQHATSAAATSTDPEMARVLAYRAWSLVHGLAMLILDKQIGRQEGLAMIDKIVSADSVKI
jgi:AcrR family transcriptional regulator